MKHISKRHKMYTICTLTIHDKFVCGGYEQTERASRHYDLLTIGGHPRCGAGCPVSWYFEIIDVQADSGQEEEGAGEDNRGGF
jgi:hypothetical protein